MLFKANITARTLESEEALAEQLYIFLKQYVPNRLKYESADEREDCIQETIMVLLKRYRKLDPITVKYINLERFFYNRANSFISLYLRKLTKERKNKAEYLRNKAYIATIESTFIEYLATVNEPVLKSIIAAYCLSKDHAYALEQITLVKLSHLGYAVIDEWYSSLQQETLDTLDTLSYAVVDEYMIKSLEAEGEDHEQHDAGL